MLVILHITYTTHSLHPVQLSTSLDLKLRNNLTNFPIIHLSTYSVHKLTNLGQHYNYFSSHKADNNSSCTQCTVTKL